MRWIVDGMNVIGTRPDAWWKDRDAAMLRLVDALERWAAAEGEDVIVVFAAQAVAADPLDRDRGHARAQAEGDAGDDEIVRRLRADAQPHGVRVVTSDRALTERAHAAGATVEGADSFRRRIEEFQ